MKLTELMSIPHNRQKQLIMLKNMIDNNEQPNIIDAGGVAGKFAMGDVEQIGYAKRVNTPAGRGEYETWYVYTGPNSIVVDGKVLKKGDKTKPVFVDYT